MVLVVDVCPGLINIGFGAHHPVDGKIYHAGRCDSQSDACKEYGPRQYTVKSIYCRWLYEEISSAAEAAPAPATSSRLHFAIWK
jgi:hypothetical protein